MLDVRHQQNINDLLAHIHRPNERNIYNDEKMINFSNINNKRLKWSCN
jgi:hypothetical protein